MTLLALPPKPVDSTLFNVMVTRARERICLVRSIESPGSGLLADYLKHADNPSSDQLREVMPGIVERHNVGIGRIMLASTVAGEAPASAIIRDLLKNDEVLALPKAEEVELAPLLDTSKRSAEAQEELRAQRKAVKKAKQEDARTRKAQSVAARRK